MKNPSHCLGLLLVTLLSFPNVWGYPELRPVINGGRSYCNPLRSDRKARSGEGIVCLHLKLDDAEYMDVSIHISNKNGWDLEDAFLWIGKNATDVPSRLEDKEAVMYFDEFPFIGRNVGNKFITFPVSLKDQMGFSCDSDSGTIGQVAAVKATIRSQTGNETINLRLVTPKAESYLGADPVMPFKLSCKYFSIEQLHNPQQLVGHINGKSTSVHRRLRGRETCPDYPSAIKLNLTETNVTQILQAAELMITVSISDSGNILKIINEQRALYERFDGWWDVNDQALVAKTRDDGVCYGMIMGTMGTNIFDQLQNLFLFPEKIRGTDCRVRGGFLDAYNTTYKDEFRRSIEECVHSCAGYQCPLVLGGHSQGGAAATIAAIDLRHYNPTVVSFGSPRPFLVNERYQCTDFNVNRHFRFVNTIAPGVYDRVSFGTITDTLMIGSDHRGIMLLLDDVNWPIADPGNNDAREPLESDIHERSLYLNRIQNIVSRGCFPVPVGLWPTGHYCTRSDECVGECSGGFCT